VFSLLSVCPAALRGRSAFLAGRQGDIDIDYHEKSEAASKSAKIIAMTAPCIAVVPAAGFGTRLRPLTLASPKELLPIGRKPVLAHVAEELLAAGITRALFIVSERKPQIQAFLGEAYTAEIAGTLRTLECDYLFQNEMRGSGDAVLRAEEWANGQAFVVAFGDCLIDAPHPSEPLRRTLATHQEQQAGITILVEQVAREKVSRYGVLDPETVLPTVPTEPFAAKDIVEKPAVEDAPSNVVVAARFVCQPVLFDYLRDAQPDPRGEINLPDSFRAMRRDGFPLWAVPLREGEARRDIGNFGSFFTTFVRYALADEEYGADVKKLLAQSEP
jgi:UTP--glucose-1-phosphate uridylyltransferase